MYWQSEKKLLNSNISPTCPYNMVNFGPPAAEISLLVWGTPANFNGFHVLAALLRSTLHCVSKNVPPFTCYKLDIHSSIIFGTRTTEKVGNQNVLYFPTSPNLCFCTTWGNRKHENCIFSLKCCMLFTKNTKHTGNITCLQLNQPSLSKWSTGCTSVTT